MTVSDMKSDKKYDQRIWRTWAVVLWKRCGRVLLDFDSGCIDSTVEIWLVGVEILTIFSMAFGMYFWSWLLA